MNHHEKLLQDYAQLAPHYDTQNPPVWQAVRELVSSVSADSSAPGGGAEPA